MNAASEYYRLWTRQLLQEFSCICHRYGLQLAPPVFSISESATRWGCWLPESREIRISSKLIRNFSWDVTLQVLKHEIAHQICSEMFRDVVQGHGPDFRKACDLLGLPEPFRRAECDIAHSMAQGGKSGQDRLGRSGILEKIRKLLALAESANDHESSLAMEKAGELMRKHNLEQLHEDMARDYTYAIIDGGRKRIEAYQRRIILILTEFFYVKAVCSSQYDPRRNEVYKTFELFGTRDNVAIAEYCYHFLENHLALLWRLNAKRYAGNTRIGKKSYYLGLLHGLAERLRERKRAGDATERASRHGATATRELVAAEDRALTRFLHARYPRLAKRMTPGSRILRGVFDDGVETGRRIVIPRGIPDRQNKEKKLLE